MQFFLSNQRSSRESVSIESDTQRPSTFGSNCFLVTIVFYMTASNLNCIDKQMKNYFMEAKVSGLRWKPDLEIGQVLRREPIQHQ